MSQKEACRRSSELLFKFWDPLISPEWLKIQTSNFACSLKVGDTKEKNEKLVKRGRGLGHVTYFLNFGTPVIYPYGWRYKPLILHADWRWGILNHKTKNRPKGGVAVVTWHTFHISRPPNISGTAEDTNFKFCKQIDHNWY